MDTFSNKSTFARKAEQLGNTVSNLDSADLPTANIIVTGITGAGKSTLLNAVFGSDLAKTGDGRPITDCIAYYSDPKIPVKIWDTVGFELDSQKTEKTMQDIRKTIAEKAKSKDQFDRIHAIWYCVSDGSSRYQGKELEFIKNLYSLGVPFIVVITKSIGGDEFEKAVRAINKEEGLENIDVIPVLAKDFETRRDTIPAFGLRELVQTTLEKLPEFIKGGFIAAQRIDVVLKRAGCEAIIFEYVNAVATGFWDKVPIANLFTTNKKILKMFQRICIMYNTVLPVADLEKVTEEFQVKKLQLVGFLLNPINYFNNQKLTGLLGEMKGKDGLKVKEDSFTDSERAAQMIAFCGYTFMVAIEGIWDDIMNEGLKNVDDIVQKIRLNISNILKKRPEGDFYGEYYGYNQRY